MIVSDASRDDLAGLRAEFAGSGFRFGSMWASAASGPDARRVYARRDGVLLTAWTAPELRIKLRERRRHPPPTPFSQAGGTTGAPAGRTLAARVLR